MRATASLAQLNHRQDFRKALAWRKSLSKQARVFLESYCLGKHPFGCDPLSTQWHKYALKIYLEAVTFELVGESKSLTPARALGYFTLVERPGLKLLHVRHPALLAVSHKRSGEIIGNYDGLSSLEHESLIEQIGLDVLPGDEIEAITLPGIASHFVVP